MTASLTLATTDPIDEKRAREALLDALDQILPPRITAMIERGDPDAARECDGYIKCVFAAGKPSYRRSKWRTIKDTMWVSLYWKGTAERQTRYASWLIRNFLSN